MILGYVKSILTPVLALILWSLVMWIWLYATRLPAIRAAHIDPATAKEPASLDVLPLKVRQVAYNYNHLMEQPTLFYALVFYTYLTHRWESDVALALAWAYVVLRVAHSLVQATINTIMVRFALHVAGTLALMGLAGWDLWKMLG
ncbi:MAG: MAPEG family protein [Caulobacteraceae bacterium]